MHTELGPGFLENVYENALCVEFAARGLRFEQQKSACISHRDIEVGEHRADLVGKNLFLVEFTAVRETKDVFFVAARSQIRAANLPEGLILNISITADH